MQSSGRMMEFNPKRLGSALTPLISVTVLVVALWVLHHTLAKNTYHDVLHALGAIPKRHLLVAAVLTVCSYLAMTLYDYLAFLYVGKRLPYLQIAFASFIGYAFSNTVGYSILSGGSIRYRLYSGWHVSSAEIARITVFCSSCSILGIAFLGGIAMLVEPKALTAALPLSLPLKPVGAIMLSGVGAYFLATTLGRQPLRLGKWGYLLPSWPIAGLQIVASAIDYTIAGAVLYALLPQGHDVSFIAFLGIFLLAIAGGMASQVPGGLGVFETLMILLLAPHIEKSLVFGSLLAFRILYYIVPLGLGASMIAGYELRRRRTMMERASRAFETWASPFIPDLLAVLTFVCGAILVFSGVTPAAHARMTVLRSILPLPAIEASHFLASLFGVGLLLLGRALQRRVGAAYVLTAALLAGGCVFSLTKGFDFEEALILAVSLAILLPCRRHFYRRASLTAQPFTTEWIGAILIVLACSVWLGLFAYKHVEYSNELWWHFSIRGDAPRSLRAAVGIAVMLLGAMTIRLMSPVIPKPEIPDRETLDRARELVRSSPSTLANLALLGDKSFLFDDARTAFIMYGAAGRSWVAMGDPVGPPTAWVDLIWRFSELCDRFGVFPVFYQVPASSLHYYLDLGMTPLKLGEEARVDLAAFSLEGSGKRSERNTLHRLEREGYAFDIIDVASVPAVLAEFRSVSSEWLAEKNTREKSFSLGCFEESYVCRFSYAVVRRNGSIFAFANLWEGGRFEELSIDLMRHRRDAPNGLMDFLFLHLMLYGKERGYRWFSLGMAPFSGFEDRVQAPMWNRMAGLLFRHGEHFYNFQGLRQYKEKFHPTWSPKYLVSPAGIALPQILANVATLISGGLAGVVKK